MPFKCLLCNPRARTCRFPLLNLPTVFPCKVTCWGCDGCDRCTGNSFVDSNSPELRNINKRSVIARSELMFIDLTELEGAAKAKHVLTTTVGVAGRISIRTPEDGNKFNLNYQTFPTQIRRQIQSFPQNYENYVDFYNFACDYETAETTRKLNLYFYPRDNSLELYDIGLKRLFLKRTVVTEVTLDDIYIGNKITIYGRTIVIRDYGNSETRRLISNMKQR